ncbi:uridine phosphorylase [Butyricicoccus sp.]|uniref:uridine phosphorylase n=1 Tax=Butyricicoccus sp. TaxID=2049021 RepID=UPI003F147DE4
MATAYSPNEEFHLKIKPGDIGSYVILPGDPGRCRHIAAYLENPQKIAENREFTTYTGTLDGVKVSVVSTGIGGPSAAIALEELIHCGAHTFIRVGTSGGMQPEVLGGDLVIATGAVRMDGTGTEYAPIEYPATAHFDVVQALQQAAVQSVNRFHIGVVQCKDSFYGQHEPENMPVSAVLKQKWDAWLGCGALASEMESATLFIVAAVRRVRIGSILLVLGNQTRRAMGLEDIQVHDTTRCIETAIAAMRLLIAADQTNP